MNRQIREDNLCNALIDLYLEEKEIIGAIPPPMPMNKQTFALASVLAAPIDPLHYINTRITNSVYHLQENADHISRNIGFNDAVQAQFWFGGLGILGIAALLGRLAYDHNKQKLHTTPASLAAPRLNRLQDIDLSRYSLTYDNADIFDTPHYRYPETPKRYMALRR